MSYFKVFGTVNVTLSTGDVIAINDITKFATIIEKYRNNPNLYVTYTIKDGERPENLAYRLYGSVDQYWTIFLMNSIADPYTDWPIPISKLPDLIEQKYPFNDSSEIHHYEDQNGVRYDPLAIMMSRGFSFQDAIDFYSLSPVTIYDYEYNLNESKRNIKLINPDYIVSLQNDLNSLFG